MTFQINDGGRGVAGRRGEAGDCVCRAIAIAVELPYAEVYAALNEAALRERPRVGRKRSSARTGIQIPTIRRCLASIGWRWVPTMQIGSGCEVHLRADELPSGAQAQTLPDGTEIISVGKYLPDAPRAANATIEPKE